jgi:peptidoglycan LD-endopeptidase LytH
VKKLSAGLLLALLLFPNVVEAQAPMENLRNVFEGLNATVSWDNDAQQIVVVRNGETISFKVGSSIAQKNGVPITMDSPVIIDPTTQKSMISVYAVYPLAKNNHVERHYIVQPGDSLWKISVKYKIPVASLMAWNGLTTTTIYPGQHIFTMDPYYVVKSGDTLYGIASQYDITVAEIKTANKLTSDNLSIGQRLYIPPEQTVAPPAKYADGQFPLVDKTYTPFENDYGDPRSFSLGQVARVHEGNDIIANAWVPIFSAYDGKVVRKGWSTLGGWRLSIRTPDNKIVFYYAHMSAYANGVTDGATIKKGQLIGFVGSTGYGPEGTSGKFVNHLHFGMYDASTSTWVAMNPYTYLKWWEKQ